LRGGFRSDLPQRRKGCRADPVLHATVLSIRNSPANSRPSCYLRRVGGVCHRVLEHTAEVRIPSATRVTAVFGWRAKLLVQRDRKSQPSLRRRTIIDHHGRASCANALRLSFGHRRRFPSVRVFSTSPPKSPPSSRWDRQVGGSTGPLGLHTARVPERRKLNSADRLLAPNSGSTQLAHPPPPG